MAQWIFQGVPSRYDVADQEQVREGKTEVWMASRFRERMQPGDIVYLWRAGDPEKRGIYAWGVIQSKPSHYEGWGWGVPVEYRKRLPRPVRSEALQRDPAFSDHLLYKMPIGTNFALSPEESKAIERAIADTVGEEYLPPEEA